MDPLVVLPLPSLSVSSLHTINENRIEKKNFNFAKSCRDRLQTKLISFAKKEHRFAMEFSQASNCFKSKIEFTIRPILRISDKFMENQQFSDENCGRSRTAETMMIYVLKFRLDRRVDKC